MIRMSENNELFKKLSKVKSCEIFYDEERFKLFVYTDGATSENVKRMQFLFLNHIDTNI